MLPAWHHGSRTGHTGHTSGLYGFPICGVGNDIKGATRSLPPGHPLLPELYQGVGQPVLIPGDMAACSYVLSGAESARTQSFGIQVATVQAGS